MTRSEILVTAVLAAGENMGFRIEEAESGWLALIGTTKDGESRKRMVLPKYATPEKIKSLARSMRVSILHAEATR